MIKFILSLFVICAEANELFLQQDIDDRFHNISQIIEENGFVFEEHEVQTEDGYLLTVHRLYLQESLGGPFQPILMQHGIEGSAYDWIMNSADKAPAFLLAREGYDVWLGNNRGNDFSLKHIKYTKDQKEFWDFDFEQMGLYDVPAEIDYILSTNPKKCDKLAAYVGHSEGTTQFFIGSSMKADYYKEKVGIFVALAPIARLDHTLNTGMKLASQGWIISTLSKLVQVLHLYDLVPQNEVGSFLNSEICSIVPHICEATYEGFFDFNDKIDNVDRVADKQSKSPQGSGWRNIVHYGQIIAAKRFQRLDLGKAGNLEKYGTEVPPLYDLSAIDVPISVHHGDVDQLSDMVDVAWLLDESQSGLRSDKIVQVKQYHFGHVSFLMAKDMSYFTDDVIPAIKSQQ